MSEQDVICQVIEGDEKYVSLLVAVKERKARTK
jgi:hypothetical protein